VPRQVEIPQVGIVEFPDSMSDDQITQAIQRDILKPVKIPGSEAWEGGRIPGVGIPRVDVREVSEGLATQLPSAISVPAFTVGKGLASTLLGMAGTLEPLGSKFEQFERGAAPDISPARKWMAKEADAGAPLSFGAAMRDLGETIRGWKGQLDATNLEVLRQYEGKSFATNPELYRDPVYVTSVVGNALGSLAAFFVPGTVAGKAAGVVAGETIATLAPKLVAARPALAKMSEVLAGTAVGTGLESTVNSTDNYVRAKTEFGANEDAALTVFDATLRKDVPFTFVTNALGLYSPRLNKLWAKALQTAADTGLEGYQELKQGDVAHEALREVLGPIVPEERGQRAEDVLGGSGSALVMSLLQSLTGKKAPRGAGPPAEAPGAPGAGLPPPAPVSPVPGQPGAKEAPFKATPPPEAPAPVAEEEDAALFDTAMDEQRARLENIRTGEEMLATGQGGEPLSAAGRKEVERNLTRWRGEYEAAWGEVEGAFDTQTAAQGRADLESGAYDRRQSIRLYESVLNDVVDAEQVEAITGFDADEAIAQGHIEETEGGYRFIGETRNWAARELEGLTGQAPAPTVEEPAGPGVANVDEEEAPPPTDEEAPPIEPPTAPPPRTAEKLTATQALERWGNLKVGDVIETPDGPMTVTRADNQKHKIAPRISVTDEQGRGWVPHRTHVEYWARGEAAPAEEVEPTAPPKVEPLPRDLAGGKPRYSYGEKQFDLEFESDIDKAAYIAAQAKPSKRDADYVAYVAKHTGMSEPEIRAAGAAVRARIKVLARDAAPGTLTIPRTPAPRTETGEPEEYRIPDKKGKRGGRARIIVRQRDDGTFEAEVSGDVFGFMGGHLATATGATRGEARAVAAGEAAAKLLHDVVNGRNSVISANHRKVAGELITWLKKALAPRTPAPQVEPRTAPPPRTAPVAPPAKPEAAVPPAPPGTWMNTWDVDEAVKRHKNHPVLARATRFLRDLRDETDAHSDGWAYWKLPIHAAGQLMGMIQHPETATEANYRRALGPIRAFYTRAGNKAGMKFPDTGIEETGPPAADDVDQRDESDKAAEARRKFEEAKARKEAEREERKRTIRAAAAPKQIDTWMKLVAKGTAGYEAGKTLRDQIADVATPEDLARLDKAIERLKPYEPSHKKLGDNWNEFWNLLHKGDTFDAPGGKAEVTETNALTMQPIIPAGPRGGWGAIGAGHRDVMDITAKLPDGSTRKFKEAELKAYLQPEPSEIEVGTRIFQVHIGALEKDIKDWKAALKWEGGPTAVISLLRQTEARIEKGLRGAHDVMEKAKAPTPLTNRLRALIQEMEGLADEAQAKRKEAEAAEPHAGDTMRRKVDGEWQYGRVQQNKAGHLYVEVIDREGRGTGKTAILAGWEKAALPEKEAPEEKTAWPALVGELHRSSGVPIPEIAESARAITNKGRASRNGVTVKIVPHPAAPAQTDLDKPHWAVEAIRDGDRSIVNADPIGFHAARRVALRQLYPKPAAPAEELVEHADEEIRDQIATWDEQKTWDWQPRPGDPQIGDVFAHGDRERVVVFHWRTGSASDKAGKLHVTYMHTPHPSEPDRWAVLGEERAPKEKPLRNIYTERGLPIPAPKSKAEKQAPPPPPAAPPAPPPEPSAGGIVVLSAPGVPTQRVPVRTADQASAIVRRFIQEHDLASSTFTGGQILDAQGKEVAHVSYNGRVWDTAGNLLQGAFDEMTPPRPPAPPPALPAPAADARHDLITQVEPDLKHAREIVADLEDDPDSERLWKELRTLGERYGLKFEPPEGTIDPRTDEMRPLDQSEIDELRGEFEDQLKEALPEAIRARADELRGEIGGLFTPQEQAAPLTDPPDVVPGTAALINTVLGKLRSGAGIGNNLQFHALAQKSFGGTFASGKFTPKDAYDALEAAVNLYLKEIGPELMSMEPRAAIARLRELLASLPTQTARSGETETHQQFSTPPHEAYVAAKVLNVQPGDIVAETSAGNGGLAVFAEAAGAQRLILNEISKRRKALLGMVFPDAHIYSVDGEYLDSLLDQSEQPTAVLMNPPFSATERLSTTDIKHGFNHVYQALLRLAPGGRLVAILGESARLTPRLIRGKMQGSQSAGWFKSLADKGYLVRANVGIAGKEYAKYGTTYGTQIVVIDKPADFDTAAPAKPEDRAQTLTGDYNTVEEAWDALSAIAADRRAPLDRGAGQVRGDGEPLSKPSPERDTGGKPPRHPGERVRRPRGTRPPTGLGAPGHRPGKPPEPGPPGSGQGPAPLPGPGLTPPAPPPQLTPQQRHDAIQKALDAQAAKADAELADMIAKLGDQLNTGVPVTEIAKFVEALARRGAAEMHRGYVSFKKFTARVKELFPKLVDFIEAQARAIHDRATELYEGMLEGFEQPAPPQPPPPPQDDTAPPEEPDAEAGSDEGEGEFVIYSPSKLREGRKHPGRIVESKAMDAVAPPNIKYKHSLPREVLHPANPSMGISGLQLESVVYAGQTHETRNQDGTRGGFYIGDGTGVGKGREIAAIAWDNYLKGRKKVLWVSTAQDLMGAAEDDITQLHEQAAKDLKITGIDKWKYGTPIEHDGALFMTYAGLIAKSGDAKKGSRLDQLRAWKPDVIIFDEAHRAKNAVGAATIALGEEEAERQEQSAARRGQRAMGAASQTGSAVVEIQRAIPEARVVYVSATGATDVKNLGYATRLGLWGPGTSFPQGFSQFLSEIVPGGMGNLEMIARELKALGKYLSRSLSYKGVNYEEVRHLTTQPQREGWDAAVAAWEIILANIDRALVATGAATIRPDGSIDVDRRARTRAMMAFWNNNQRFYLKLLTAFKVPSVIAEAEKALEKGNRVIISLIATGESQQKSQAAKADIENLSYDELDFSPRQMVENYLMKAFPVYQMVEEEDEHGNVKLVVLKDDKGNPVVSREAVAIRDRLVAELQKIALPENPLEQIINYFEARGIGVAELTGRKKRLVRDEATGKAVQRKRVEGVALNQQMKAERESFVNGDKQIAITSQAASTGISLHAGNRFKNKEQRTHILMELPWSADIAMQIFGRSHRSDQTSPPEYKIVSTDIGGEKRFYSTIARRLGSLGALSKGERKAGGGSDVLAKYNYESDYGVAAANSLFQQLDPRVVPGDAHLPPLMREVGAQGVKDRLNMTQAPEGDKAVTGLLNRILNTRVDFQNELFEYFHQLFEGVVETARAAGTFDDGTQDVRAEKVEMRNQEVVRKDPATGAETIHYELDATVKVVPEDWFGFFGGALYHARPAEGRQGPSGFGKRKSDGKVVAVHQGAPHADPRTGAMSPQAITLDVRGRRDYMSAADFGTKFEEIAQSSAKALWEAQTAALPPTEVKRLHLIGGAVLSLWPKLKRASKHGAMSITRVTTADGKRVVGLEIPAKAIAGFLGQGGGNTPEAIFERVWEEGERVGLSGGVTLAKRKQWGEDFFSVTTLNPQSERTLAAMGMDSEKYGSQTIFYLHVDDENLRPDGKRALKAILEQFPPVEKPPTAEEAAEQRIRERGNLGGGTLGSFNLDPRDLVDLAIIGAAKLQRGAVKFKAWAKEMLAEFGEQIRPHLLTIYRRAREHGPHGPILREFRHDAKGAIAKLKELQTGEAVAALHHPEVGDIDIVWGWEGTAAEDFEDGFGLAKILRKHPGIIDGLQARLSEMRVNHKRSGKNRLRLESATHEASIRLEWDGAAKKWLLTAYEKTPSAGRTTDVPGTHAAERQTPPPGGASSSQPSESSDGPTGGTTSGSDTLPSESGGPPPPGTSSIGQEPAATPPPTSAEAAARARITERGNFTGETLGAFNLDPRDLADLVIIGAAKLRRGVTRFADWSKAMVAQFGARIRPHLLRIYQRARQTKAADLRSHVREGARPLLSRIASEGKAGLEVARLVGRAGDLGDTGTGKRIARLMDTEITKLTAAERINLVEVLEARKAPLNPRVDATARVVRSIFDEIAREAGALGLQKRVSRLLKPGEPIPPGLKLNPFQAEAYGRGHAIMVSYRAPFAKRANYFPHSIPHVDRLKAGKIRADVIDNILRLGTKNKDKTPMDRDQATAFLDSYVLYMQSGKKQQALIDYLIGSGQAGSEAQAMTILRKMRDAAVKRQGSLEYSRIVNLPLWDPDPTRVLPTQIAQQTMRLARVEQFGGQENQKLKLLVNQIRRAGANHEFVQEALDTILKDVRSADKPNEELARVLRYMSGFKLGLTALKNVWQGPLNTFLAADARAVLDGARGVLSPEGRRFGVESGAAHEAIMNEAMRNAGEDGRLLGQYLKWTGFAASEQFNRIFAANAGASWATRNLSKLIADPKNTLARDSLAELGLDVKTVLKRGKLTADEVLLAAKKFSDLTQFRSRPEDLPAFASSPWGKVFFQFKSYGYGQARLVAREVVDEFRAGRPGRATRNLLTLGTVYPFAGSLALAMRAMLTGDDRERKKRESRAEWWIRRYLEGLIGAGALGLMTDFSQAGSIGRLAETMMGPGLSTVAEVGEAAVSLRWRRLLRVAFRHTPGVGLIWQLFEHRGLGGALKEPRKKAA
jgi:hypothetical protein